MILKATKTDENFSDFRVWTETFCQSFCVSSTQISDISANIIHHIEYMPYGESFVEQRSNWGTNYKFNGKELDEETGYYYYGARYYTPDLSIWLSVDPLSDKYPSLSPYNYCANNPIKYVDPDGRDLDVALNQESANDLKSIVNHENRDRVIINEKNGKVSYNIEGLSKKDLKNDIGLSLIVDMVNSDKKMLFETTDFALLKDENNNRFSFVLDDKITGVFNASNFGKDGNNGHYHRPRDGYDGHVGISLSGSFAFQDNNGNARRSVVFHELAENYLRTHEGRDYNGSRRNSHNFGSHGIASKMEGSRFGNSKPGGNLKFNQSNKSNYIIFPLVQEYYMKKKLN